MYSSVEVFGMKCLNYVLIFTNRLLSVLRLLYNSHYDILGARFFSCLKRYRYWQAVCFSQSVHLVIAPFI